MLCRRLLLIPMVLAASVAFASDDLFVSPHVLETKEGAIAGVLWGLQVSPPSMRVVMGPDGKPVVTPNTDSLGRQLRDFDGVFSLDGNDGLLPWLSSTLNGKPWTQSYSIYSLQKGTRFSFNVEFEMNLEVDLPACNANSRALSGGRIHIAAPIININGTIQPSRDREMAAKKQKMWMCSNFRLRVGDLPCSNVRKTLPIKFIIATDKDRDGTPARMVGGFTFNVPMSDSAAFYEAFKSTQAGTPKEYPLRLDYLDDEGNPLWTVSCVVAITAVGPADPFGDPADPDAMLQVKAIPHPSYSGAVHTLKAIT